MRSILIVDDEEPQREALGGYLKKRGFHVLKAGSGEEALELVGQGIDIAIVDLKLPGMDGLELLNRLKRLDPKIEVLVVTAYGSIETAVVAMKSGAFHYLTKPIDLEELNLLIDRAFEKLELEKEVRLLREELKDLKKVPDIVAESPLMKEVLSLIFRVAPTQATVLLTGESGTGKELLARAIHEASPRKNARFVAISCAAIPETLLESELFGYEKGAFTGAERAKPGKFELADRGTLFLDEVGDLPKTLQPKLLRVIQERELERLGGTRPIKTDVRLIAATNQDLEGKVKDGTFREDLYYRLNVVTIRIPPLRERREDVLPLAYHFLKKFSEEIKKPILGFTREAERLLLSYTWPGNVRELENAVERAVVLTRKNYIEVRDLPIASPEMEEEPLRLEEVEAKHIKRVLRMTGGNLSKASEILGIHRNTLREKMKKYRLSVG